MTFSTISSSKEKGRLQTTLSILNKNAFNTLNVKNSSQMHQEKFNLLSMEGRIYDTSLFDKNDNYNTFCIKATNRLKQLFDKRL